LSDPSANGCISSFCHGRRLPLFRSPTETGAEEHFSRDVLFQILGVSGRMLTCAAFDTEFGLELRLSYGEDLMPSQLFGGLDREERCAEAADSWHLALVEKGFSEVPQ
jgi:hypothetical protein